MPKLEIDWSDGRYYTHMLSDDEAAAAEADGCIVAHLEDHIYEAYRRDCERDAVWQALWCAISNEQYMRRREKELMPLEDAQREIASLKEELARAKRLESFYEERYAQQLGERHRDQHVEYTCVYPQPGADVSALPEAWREDAQDILDQYRPDRAEDGLKYQGCCCGHQHQRLDDEAAQKLRVAGFLVENDTETA